MLRIHTAHYLHPDSHFPFSYLTRANLKLSDWCRKVGAEFISETFSLTHWSSLSPWQWSFEFGTVVKFASIQGFLNNSHRGDRYVWFDSDIYPTDAAYQWSPAHLPVNGFWGWWHEKPLWQNNPAHRHQFSKIAWANTQSEGRWFSVGSGIYSLSRKDTQDLWDFINANASIDTSRWWQQLRDRQEATHERVVALGGVDSQSWMYGLDEHWIEEWVNVSGVQWQEITHEQHSVPRINPHAILQHYDGMSKLQYPTMHMPNQTVCI